jgi:iron complex transport system substrate-binding protein
LKPIDQVTHDVIGLAMRIHTALGPGLFESVYEIILTGKLIEMGYRVDRQMPIDIEFEGTQFRNAFKIDLLVDQQLIVEIKSSEQSNALHAKQLLTYLRLKNLPVGLVINFGCSSIKDGIRRVVNNHKDSANSAASA